jgi:hypothetical protein
MTGTWKLCWQHNVEEIMFLSIPASVWYLKLLLNNVHCCSLRGWSHDYNRGVLSDKLIVQRASLCHTAGKEPLKWGGYNSSSWWHCIVRAQIPRNNRHLSCLLLQRVYIIPSILREMAETFYVQYVSNCVICPQHCCCLQNTESEKWH